MSVPGGTLISEEALLVLQNLLEKSLPLGGEVWECGVYWGGSALWLARTVERLKSEATLRLFDSFEGIQLADESKGDTHKNGDFNDVDCDSVVALFVPFPFVSVHPGIFPITFASMENSRICFAHIDCDVYQSVMACLAFIWPRLIKGGYIVLDDYHAPTCIGAKNATDDFLESLTDYEKSDGAFPQLILHKPL